jgi:tRNA pseudouridine55 synthase
VRTTTTADTEPALSGVLVVDKPAGPTSHDIVDRVRRVLGVRRVGHTGTLDPFATGVLAICVGRATRLARFLSGGEKVYCASVRLGFATDTDDLTGRPLGPVCEASPTLEQVGAACMSLTGTIQQKPPAYSAKSVGGRRSYALARDGRPVELQPSLVTVYGLEIVRYEPPELVLDVRCSSGTYVRALARDLGAQLGVGGHLTALTRTRNGDFALTDAVSGDALEPAATRLIPLARLLPGLLAVQLDEPGERAVRQGQSIYKSMTVSGFPEGGVERVRLMSRAGELLALAVQKAPLAGRNELALQPDVVLVA